MSTNDISKQLREKATNVAERNAHFGWKKENLLEWKAADLIDQLLAQGAAAPSSAEITISGQ